MGDRRRLPLEARSVGRRCAGSNASLCDPRREIQPWRAACQVWSLVRPPDLQVDSDTVKITDSAGSRHGNLPAAAAAAAAARAAAAAPSTAADAPATTRRRRDKKGLGDLGFFAVPVVPVQPPDAHVAWRNEHGLNLDGQVIQQADVL
jgi:hypothetical protein